MNEEEKKPIHVKVTIKPKPVTFISGKYNYYHGHDTFKELSLLKAMRITSDPKVLMQMTGIKKMADLTRTIDKISSRKEYNHALRSLGMDFDWIAKGFKKEAEFGEKSGDRIKALQIILKSLGMDKYEDLPTDTGTWEDMVLKASEKKENLLEAPKEVEVYEVNVPETPEAMKEMREKENRQGQSIYE